MTPILLLCILFAAAQGVSGEVTPKVREKRVRADLLRERIAKDKQEFLKIQNGPCLCGAKSHADCKTKEICEPAEEAKKAGFRDDAVAAGRELDLIITFLEYDNRVGKEIQGREAQAAHLAALRDKLNAVIRKNAEKQDWREDLTDWVRESEKAQSEALGASLNMLAGPLGGIGKEIEKHEKAQKGLQKALAGTRPLLTKALEAMRAARGAAVGPAVNEWSRLNGIEMTLMEMNRGPETAQACWECIKLLTEGTEKLVQANQTKDDFRDAYDRQKFMGVLGALGDVVKETLANYAMDEGVEVLAETSKMTAQGLQGVRWALDYGLASWRFYESYNFINSIVGQVETDLKVIERLSAKVKSAQDEILDIRKECKILEESRAEDTPDMARAIRGTRKLAQERITRYHSP
jgi:hypothetical protein